MKKIPKALEKVHFEWYVLNYDFNGKKIVKFNIFNNWVLREAVVELVNNFLKTPEMSYEEYKEELRKDIAWQERGRSEYEISVGRPFEEDCNNLEKWDCYDQVEPNLDILAKHLIQSFLSQMSNNYKVCRDLSKI